MPQKKKGKKKNNKSRSVVKPVVLANNQDPRPVRARRNKQSTPNRVSHVAKVCSVTNPFCPAAKNAKWPDGTAGNTLTEQFRGTSSLTVDASGNFCAVYAAAAPYGWVGSTITAGVAAFGSGYATYKANSMLATYGDRYRIVSFGVIVRCIASATTASGVITLGTMPVPAVSSSLTMGQQLYSEVTVKAIQPGLELSWISSPFGTGARDFVTQSTTTSATNDWNSLIIEISGATASSTPILVEWFLNVEFTPLTTQRALTALAKPNPPKSVAAETAVSKVHSSLGSFIEGGVKAVEEKVMQKASEAISALTSDPLESIAAIFGF
jgi:hypothetical protein